MFKQKRGLNKNMDNASKSSRLMEGVGLWTSYYRLFPHIFVKEYFGITLKLFQCFLIYAMQHFNIFMYIASRGQGERFALYKFGKIGEV